MVPKPVDAASPTAYTWQEVAKHNKEGDAWVIFGDGVYDITRTWPLVSRRCGAAPPSPSRAPCGGR